MPGINRAVLTAWCMLACADALGADPAAQPPSVDQVCKLTTCRPATKIKLDMGHDRYYVVDQPAAPYTFDGMINVLAGETVTVSASAKGDKLADLRYVPEPGKEAPVVVARLQQYVDNQGQYSMLLTVTNPFDRPLVYTANIQPAGRNSFLPSSICPISPHRIGAETWSYPLVQVLLKDFRFLVKGEAIGKDCLAGAPPK
jgi:hypothetical protein